MNPETEEDKRELGWNVYPRPLDGPRAPLCLPVDSVWVPRGGEYFGVG